MESVREGSRPPEIEANFVAMLWLVMLGEGNLD